MNVTVSSSFPHPFISFITVMATVTFRSVVAEVWAGLNAVWKAWCGHVERVDAFLLVIRFLIPVFFLIEEFFFLLIFELLVFVFVIFSGS